MSDTKSIVEKIIKENPKAVESAKKNPKAINKLVGLVMKTKPNSNPKEVLKYLHEYFGIKQKEKKKKSKIEVFTKRYWRHKKTGRTVVRSFVFATDSKCGIDKETDKPFVDIREGWQYYHDLHSKKFATDKMPINEFEKEFEYIEEQIEIETI